MRNTISLSIIAIVLSTIVLGGCCSAPPVTHSRIGEEIRDIEHWKIVWPGNPEVLQNKIPAFNLKEESKYSLEEYCNRYVESIKSELRQWYGFDFSENFPRIGRIEITLRGEKIPDWMKAPVKPQESKDNLSDHSRLIPELPPDHMPTGRSADNDKATAAVAGAAIGTLALSQLFLTDDDKVREVQLRILDYDGTDLGHITIGGDLRDNVTPNFVADVLHQIMTDGEFKKSEVGKHKSEKLPSRKSRFQPK